MTFAPDGRFARQCPGCGAMSWPKPEWDESPHAAFCINCGLGMVKLACRECGDALMVQQGGMFYGSHIGHYCPSCGADNRPRVEPQMREKPKKPKKITTTMAVERAIKAGGYVEFDPATGILMIHEPEQPTKLPVREEHGSFKRLMARAKRRMWEVKRAKG